jgi:molybdate transport system substrate-binding protein
MTKRSRIRYFDCGAGAGELQLFCIVPIILYFHGKFRAIMRPGLLLLIIVLLTTPLSAQNNRIMIGAASDLKFALDSIITSYRNTHPGVVVSVSYGSSGKLFEQILNGAPFHVYFSADIEYPKRLREHKLTGSEVYTYGFGRLVLWSTKFDPRTTGIDLLRNADVKKIAIANPLHAPYGRKTMEVLAYYKLDDEVKPRLVYGENIGQAAQFVTSGAADVGVIALALALSPTMKSLGGQYYIIPDGSHSDLEQGFVVLKQAEGRHDVAAFVAYMNGAEAKQILAYFGFREKL